MVLVAIIDGSILAELLVRLVVRIDEVPAAVLQPGRSGFDPEMVVALAGQLALPAALSSMPCARVTEAGMPYLRI